MPNLKQLTERAAQLMKQDAVLVTAVEIEKGVVQRIQVYFWDENEAAMDVITKDDLVQNWPDAGVYTLDAAARTLDKAFHRVEMFEGVEDMYFRIDGTRTEADDFGSLPPVLFMETVEAICELRDKTRI